jgi:hypothetical protein
MDHPQDQVAKLRVLLVLCSGSTPDLLSATFQHMPIASISIVKRNHFVIILN